MRCQARRLAASAGRWYASRAGSGQLSYFAVLGVPQSASTQEIKDAFREVHMHACNALGILCLQLATDSPCMQKAKQLHPDAAAKQGSAGDFVQLLTAYKVRHTAAHARHQGDSSLQVAP